MPRPGAACLAAVLASLALAAPADAAAPPAPAVAMHAVGLSAGYGFTCSVQADRTVACFGTNADGQLGLPQYKPWALVAKRIAGIAHARSVAAGWDFACVLLADGRVRCFGDDRHGQLGTAATRPRQWTPAPAVPGLAGVVQLAAGYDHTCARTSARRVYCWGNNATGQLGRSPRSLPSSATPVRVEITAVIDVAAGAGFNCAVRANHAVWCWGENGSLQLGRSLRVAYDATPVRIAGLPAARSVVTGSGHACALLVTRRVACWGENLRGQLGLPTSVPYSQSPRLVPGVAGVTALAAGFDHTCALRAGGSVTCWGSDNDGQLGNGTFEATATPTAVLGLHHATAIAAGVFFTCARESSGRVQCWGAGSLGELGTGARARLARPGHVALVRDTSGA